MCHDQYLSGIGHTAFISEPSDELLYQVQIEGIETWLARRLQIAGHHNGLAWSQGNREVLSVIESVHLALRVRPLIGQTYSVPADARQVAKPILTTRTDTVGTSVINCCCYATRGIGVSSTFLLIRIIPRCQSMSWTVRAVRSQKSIAAGFVHLDSKNYREVEVLKSSG